jgi:hypothetical protein
VEEQRGRGDEHQKRDEQKGANDARARAFFQAPFELVGKSRKFRLLSVLLRTLHEAEEFAEV